MVQSHLVKKLIRSKNNATGYKNVEQIKSTVRPYFRTTCRKDPCDRTYIGHYNSAIKAAYAYLKVAHATT